MNIQLTGISKRYRYEWIIRNLTFSFEKGQQYAIQGPNGSGKSTFLRMVSGHLTPSKGKVKFLEKKQSIALDQVYHRISYAAPYIELIEELTLKEIIEFVNHFKSFQNNLTTSQIVEILGFEKSLNKPVKYFSSGMKQRLKLALAICVDTPVLLLDEPTTNLDAQGVAWYRTLIEQYGQNRLLIIASNIDHDFDFCKHRLNIMDYKKKAKKVVSHS